MSARISGAWLVVDEFISSDTLRYAILSQGQDVSVVVIIAGNAGFTPHDRYDSA